MWKEMETDDEGSEIERADGEGSEIETEMAEVAETAAKATLRRAVPYVMKYVKAELPTLVQTATHNLVVELERVMRIYNVHTKMIRAADNDTMLIIRDLKTMLRAADLAAADKANGIDNKGDIIVRNLPDILRKFIALVEVRSLEPFGCVCINL